MTSRALLYLSLLGLCVLVVMATVAETEDAADTETDLTDHRVERRSLMETLLAKRSVGTGEEGQGETETTGKRKGRRRGKGRGKGKGKGKGRGRGRRNKGPPQYASCLHPMGITCTCDMRFAKFKDDPVKQSKYFTIC
ncbi:uncharacterized protein LOC119727142 [Patiria miniata]|uniref:Uncharacterized protein n=1 Tax=Patiria miniata TaxID=46514 RepID=A0A913ZUK8_PATMI|nr:uncharacterized protein LOC119727142 [Patiria miniata]